LVACPSCFAKIFEGARYCSYCGAEASREDAASRPVRACPECQRPMSPAKVGSVMLDECTTCGGLWVDPASFERICAEREEQASVLQTSSHAPGTAPASRPSGRYWPCPECQRLMNRQNFAHVSGVIVDVCKGHGIWFDQGELRRIVEFIRGGGMGRARAREMEDLEAERERLRQAQIDARLASGRASLTHPDTDHETPDYGAVLSALRGVLKSLF
jgi:Zn-finger nucleic acid-binding protein